MFHMSSLRDSIQRLAEDFASGVMRAIRSSSLEDILGQQGDSPRRGRPRSVSSASPSSVPVSRPVTKRSTGRLGRRSTEDLEAVAASIVSLVRKHPKGLRSEQIRKELGIEKREWLRPLGVALSSHGLTKKGEKRSTTYFAK
jgi:hypothetical protein